MSLPNLPESKQFKLKELHGKTLAMEYKEIIDNGQKTTLLMGVDTKTTDRYVIFFSIDYLDMPLENILQ